MLKRHEIQVLPAGRAHLGASGGADRRVYRDSAGVAVEERVTTVDNAAERARRQIGRPSTAAVIARC
jgi:hypothetical protein